MGRYNYLIYYTMADKNNRLEGNITLDRTCAIDSDAEVENVRQHITDTLAGNWWADLIAESGGKVVIANIMRL